jgi:hypothetical protein
MKAEVVAHRKTVFCLRLELDATRATGNQRSFTRTAHIAIFLRTRFSFVIPMAY